jgi:hypothetical protein
LSRTPGRGGSFGGPEGLGRVPPGFTPNRAIGGVAEQCSVSGDGYAVTPTEVLRGLVADRVRVREVLEARLYGPPTTPPTHHRVVPDCDVFRGNAALIEEDPSKPTRACG